MGRTFKHQDGTKYWHATTPREGLAVRCAGTGMLDCECGGDMCICGNFGKVECYGCPDCEDVEDGYGEEGP